LYDEIFENVPTLLLTQKISEDQIFLNDVTMDVMSYDVSIASFFNLSDRLTDRRQPKFYARPSDRFANSFYPHNNNVPYMVERAVEAEQQTTILPIVIPIVNMWNRIAKTTSNSSSSMYRSLLQQTSNRSLLPRIFGGYQNASSHFTPSSMIRRQKHSQTQIKRLFKEHPARLRVEKRMWNIDRAQPRVIFPDETSSTVMDTLLINASTAEQQSQDTKVAISPLDESLTELTPQLTYPPIYTIPITLPNGWFAPMDPKLRPKYPFSVRRTKNKPKDAIGFLPIYTKYRYVRCYLLYFVLSCKVLFIMSLIISFICLLL
jgi:hypothetical protein